MVFELKQDSIALLKASVQSKAKRKVEGNLESFSRASEEKLQQEDWSAFQGTGFEPSTLLLLRWHSTMESFFLRKIFMEP